MPRISITITKERKSFIEKHPAFNSSKIFNEAFDKYEQMINITENVFPKAIKQELIGQVNRFSEKNKDWRIRLDILTIRPNIKSFPHDNISDLLSFISDQYLGYNENITTPFYYDLDNKKNKDYPLRLAKLYFIKEFDNYNEPIINFPENF